MLTRLTATASVVILGATLAVALPAGTARADCNVINGVVSCQASDTDHKPGSGNSGKNGNGGGKAGGLGPGCADLGNGVPGAVCPINPPAAVQRVPAADLAWQAFDKIIPPDPQINWSPHPRTYVQLSTRLWIDDLKPIPLTPLPAGAQTVTATVTPEEVAWDLVEKQISCKPDLNGTCADTYTYQRSSASQPAGKYHVTATVTWTVTWQCTGPCDQPNGTLPDVHTTGAADIPVDEIQTESQPG